METWIIVGFFAVWGFLMVSTSMHVQIERYFKVYFGKPRVTRVIKTGFIDEIGINEHGMFAKGTILEMQRTACGFGDMDDENHRYGCINCRVAYKRERRSAWLTSVFTHIRRRRLRS